MSTTTTNHRWIVERQDGLNDWVPAGLDSASPITQGQFDWWTEWAKKRLGKDVKLRIVHRVTTTTVEHTRVEPVEKAVAV